MTNIHIPYKSFCWVIGTTSFRTAKLNLKIEEQLLLLNEFHRKISIEEKEWKWDNILQEEYYDFIHKKNFLTGKSSRKDKDAREKTSGLVDIGLITQNRLITKVGLELLNIANNNNFKSNNIFNINKDSFIYLKQLLKTSVNVDGNIVRPLIILIKCLTELDFLSYKELTYFIPLIKDIKSAEKIISDIRLYRESKLDIEEIIYNNLMQMDNYKIAEEIFINSIVTEDLICLIGMNRKSRHYDKAYYKLYQAIKDVFIDNSKNYENLLYSAKNTKQDTLWKNLIFIKPTVNNIRKNGKDSINQECPFLICKDEKTLKQVFFKYLHVFKAMATLQDYFDLNRRYFNLTDIIIFEDYTIKLDTLPKYYFKKIINTLYEDAFKKNSNLTLDIHLKNISDAFNIDIKEIYNELSSDLKIVVNTTEEVNSYLETNRYQRFNALIDKKFNDNTLIELLDYFKNRDDKKIEELVTDEATIPTIFEYILGIIWYKISGRKGKILDFMKLSLEANLLPKTHASGGSADIVYEYEATSDYPKHSLLLEATLSDKSNQRRMEMEPVSRHLGDHKIKSNNPHDYSVFISTYLDQNVISDFRFRSIMPYIKNDTRIVGMKIIPLDTDSLKKIILNQTNYTSLYRLFEKNHGLSISERDVSIWHKMLLEDITAKYEIN